MNSFNQAEALRALKGLEDSGWARSVEYWAQRIAANGWDYGVQRQTQHRLGALKITAEEWITFKAYCGRYVRFCRHMKELRHRWTKDPASTIYYADNSVDVEEVSQLTGERRRKQVVGPHGDLCF
jgi:hypothetical protein